MNILKKSWNDPTADDRLETVFAGRNKSYGAYVIRHDYEKNLLRSFFTVSAAGIFLMLLYNYLSGQHEIYRSKPNEVILQMELPPPPVPVPPLPEPAQASSHTSDPAPPKPVVVDHIIAQPVLPVLPVSIPLPGNPGKDTSALTDPLPVNTNAGTAAKPLLVSEQMPSFPGGEAELMAYMQRNIHYPDAAKRALIQGTLYVQFIVTSSGKIEQIELKNRIGGGCDEEAVRSVKQMPQWIPGKQNGQAVAVQYVLPVRFTLH